MNFLGLDQSVAKAGIAVIGPCNSFHAWTEEPGPKLRSSARLDHWSREHVRIVGQYAPAGAAIEGYAFGKLEGSRAHSTGECGSIPRLVLYRRGIPLLIVPPNILKKFATGSTTADKVHVGVALFKRWGYEGKNDDECDAGILGLMAEAKFGTPRQPLTQFQREALSKCEVVYGLPQAAIPVRIRTRPGPIPKTVQQVAQSG